jgi:hypothetical protein
MRVRLLVFGAAGLLALGMGGPSFAAYDPSLVVVTRNASAGSSASVVLSLGGGSYQQGDDTTGKITVYAPAGYAVKLDHPAGTAIGGLDVFILVGGVPAGAQFGTVKVDDPANHVANSCAPGTHDAVWILEFTFAGTRVRLPVYVDRVTASPESAYASARMLACIPPAQAGVTVKDAIFGLRGVFTNPSARGTYPWNAVFVPYTAGTATLNAPGAVQSTSSLRLPVTLNIKTSRRGGRLIVVACVREAGRPVSGAHIDVLRGSPFQKGFKAVAAASTNRGGCATTSIQPRRHVRRMFAIAQIRIRPASGCTPTLAPRCSGVSLGGVGPVVRVFRVRR